MTNQGDGQDGFEQGVQSWLRSMESSRRALEDLGRNMGRSMRTGSPVAAADLERVVQALSLLEEAQRALQERVAAGEAHAAQQDARITALQEQLVSLTGAVSSLVDRVVGK